MFFVSGTQLENVFVFFLEPATPLVQGGTTNCLSLALPLTLLASQRHVCFERLFWLWWTENPQSLKTMQY